MKTLIVGTGAVGGYFGGRLVQSGADVTFLCREESLEAINRKGIYVKSINGDFNVKIKALSQLENSEKFDLIVFAVKGYSLDSACDSVKKTVGENSLILSLLNGVESEDFLSKKFGVDKVIGGIAFIGAAVESPGKINHSAAGFLTIGEPDGSLSDRIKNVAEIFSRSSVKCKISPVIKKEIWIKMVWNIGFNAITAITSAYVSEALANPETRRIIEQLMDETIKVAEAKGIVLPDDLVEKTISKTEKVGAIKTSMLQDREKGKRTEIECLNGAIVRIGREVKIPTPINETIYGLMKLIDSTGYIV